MSQNLREYIDKLRDEGYAVADVHGEDPYLIDPLGQAVETWRDRHPYDELLGRDEYEVEKFVAHKKTAKGYSFLVKWEGYPDEENTWEEPDVFLPTFCKPWADYCKKKKLKVDLLDCLGGGEASL